ncbi:MAG TPA: hypothetical protein VGI31_03360 [Streptosporangiaceae bacterium]
MRTSWQNHRLFGLVLLIAAGALALATMSLVGSGTARAQGAAAGAKPGAGVAPRATGEIDCNGLSPVQRPVKAGIMCEDPRGPEAGRFTENGHYIGHDEPSVRLISDQPGSGSNVTVNERLPVDPGALPTVKHPARDVTHWFELSIAPWLSIDVCDPHSTPLLPCKPTSDTNAPHGKYPGAGAAFVELQFYPPGFAPFTDNLSCNDSQWCSALTIDSLECAGTGACNGHCVEPVNSAFIQTNGVPTGPPSPQLSNRASFTPNAHTLLMNPGDRISVHMFDAKVAGGRALEVRETDFSTGQSGFMIASAANGFMNTSPFTCDGKPFNFQPEYSSAGAHNLLPWGIGPYMINDQYEIGHFEACTSLRQPVTSGDPSFKQCVGPYEQGSDQGNPFEPNDAPCYPFGDTHGGTAQPNLVTGCDVFAGAIGDLDYDGSPYWADWPDSTVAGPFPTPFEQLQPTTVGGQQYPQIQFVTDASATEFNTRCDLETGSGCVLPPKGPGHFYPYFTQAKVGGRCVWEFGNMRNGNTFGGDAQYGKVTPHTIGAFAGAIRANPSC